MISRITMSAICAAAVTMAMGCHADESCCGGTSKSCPSAKTNQQMKAATPDGEVLYVVTVWDANIQPADNSATKSCTTAKCWKTSNGKTYCAKPLKTCKTTDECKGKECFKDKKSGQIMTVQNDPAAVKADTKTHYAVKEVKPCPTNGADSCPAKEHVTMPGNKKGCAKADAKLTTAQSNAQQPVPMEDEVEEDDVFLVTAVAD